MRPSALNRNVLSLRFGAIMCLRHCNEQHRVACSHYSSRVNSGSLSKSRPSTASQQWHFLIMFLNTNCDSQLETPPSLGTSFALKKRHPSPIRQDARSRVGLFCCWCEAPEIHVRCSGKIGEG